MKRLMSLSPKSRPRPPLTIDQYVHRVTLGLPRGQRLDAATELRAHLLERVAEYQGHGYAREEAEFLAVRGMGEVADAHPQLWRERLTTLGWPVLALLLVSGLGWTAYREWLPPREGVMFVSPTPADISFLFSQPDAPRGTYQAAELTLPRGTKTLVYVNVASPETRGGNEQVFLFSKGVAQETAENVRGRVHGSYRYQERWLWTSERLNCQDASGLLRPSVRFYVTGQTMPSPFWAKGSQNTSGLASMVGPCNNPHVALHQVTQRLASVPPSSVTTTVPPDGEGVLVRSRKPVGLRLNHWTVLARLTVDPRQDPNTYGMPPGGYSREARASYLAVMPLSTEAPAGSDFGYSWGRGYVKLVEQGPALRLPPLIPVGEDTG